MKKLTESEVIALAEEYGWTVNNLRDCGYTVPKDEEQYELCKYSPAGEDFSFSIDVKKDSNIETEVGIYAEQFDEEEHIKMWIEAQGEVSGVPDAKTLVEDAAAIHQMLDDLALIVQGIRPEKNHPSPQNGMSLEKLLREHFKCKKPVRKNSFRTIYYSEGDTSKTGLTVKGETAYSKLTNLIYDLELLCPDEINAESIIEILDDMVKGECYGLRGNDYD